MTRADRVLLLMVAALLWGLYGTLWTDSPGTRPYAEIRTPHEASAMALDLERPQQLMLRGSAGPSTLEVPWQKSFAVYGSYLYIAVEWRDMVAAA